MSVAAGVSDAAIAVRDKLRGKIGQTKVKRYWPGKAPEWAEEGDEYHDNIRMVRASLEKAFPKDDLTKFPSKDDRRLRRLAETQADNKEELRADHRKIRQAEIVSTAELENEKQDMEVEEEDDDALEERRRRIREKQLMKEQEDLMPEEEEPEEEEEEEESEYETDSEEDVGFAMVKPVFIPKAQRDTIVERERIEEEERHLEELVKRRLEERKAETKQIVVQEVKKDMEIQKSLQQEEANIADVDTDDDEQGEEDYEAWKVREMARLKRDKEEREAKLKEEEELVRVRNMTEEERREYERKNPKPAPSSKQKWTFMQKYYHKGAFFQAGADDKAATVGTDHIFNRDFSAPTGEDKMDKTILPKVMQVKHFGRSGRTKWTHLVNEDTTDWNNPYVI